jgi:hypothetical protein
VFIQNSPNSILTGSAIKTGGQKMFLGGVYIVDFAIEGHSFTWAGGLFFTVLERFL